MAGKDVKAAALEREPLTLEASASDLRLYEVAGEVMKMEGMLVATGGEITDEIKAEWEGWNAKLDEKVERVLAFIKNRELLALSAKREKERLGQIQTAAQNAADRNRDYLLFWLRQLQIDSVATGLGKVRRSKQKKGKVSWDGEPRDIPQAYQRHAEPSVDKTLVQEAIDAGIDVEELGFTISDPTEYLTIS